MNTSFSLSVFVEFVLSLSCCSAQLSVQINRFKFQNCKKMPHNFTTASFLRQRLTLSLLSSTAVRITQIRSSLDTVGLLPHELSFIQLLVSLSNGTRVKISETGTELHFVPGVLSGGPVTIEVDAGRDLGYYLEPILILAPFCKEVLVLELSGRLGSVYSIKHGGLWLLKGFGVEANVEMISRSSSTSTIRFTSTTRRQLRTLRHTETPGKVKKVRGLAYGFRVSPQLLNRVMASAKAEFHDYISDVHITTDQVKRSKSTTAGYGLVLYAETTKGVVYCEEGFVGGQGQEGQETTTQQLGKRKFDVFSEESESTEQATKKQDQPTMQSKPTSPEELATSTARSLLREMSTLTTVPTRCQYLVLALMALSPRDVASVHMSKPSPLTVQYLRDLKTFFGVVFRVEEGDTGVKYSCLGTGYSNLNKRFV